MSGAQTQTEGTPITTPEQMIEYDLAFMVRGLDGVYRRRKYPVERAQYLLLLHLLGGRRSSGDLATRLGLDHSTVTRQVAALERNGYVRRHANPEDGRSALIEATDLGRERCLEMRELRIEGVEAMLSHWSSEDRLKFAELIRRFNGVIMGLSDKTYEEELRAHRARQTEPKGRG